MNARVSFGSVLVALAVLVAAPGCSKEPPPSQPPSGDEPAPGPGPTTPADRPELTAAECEAQGGVVVGDIGDGAVHQPDYTCAETGAPPVGTIVAEEGGPIGVEGAVCCGADL